MSGRGIDGTECGSWEAGTSIIPTPAAQSRESTMEQIEQRKEKYGGKQRAIYLPAYVKMFPTPQSRDYKGADTNPESKRFSKKTELNSFVATPTNSMMTNQDMEQAKFHSSKRPDYQDCNTGSLNPNWVEWLMGYPIGWTDLKD